MLWYCYHRRLLCSVCCLNANIKSSRRLNYFITFIFVFQFLPHIIIRTYSYITRVCLYMSIAYYIVLNSFVRSSLVYSTIQRTKNICVLLCVCLYSLASTLERRHWRLLLLYVVMQCKVHYIYYSNRIVLLLSRDCWICLVIFKVSWPSSWTITVLSV